MSDFQSINGLVGRLPTTFETETDPGEIDKNGFLQLLIAQMQNQDPLEPMENTEYAANLAQFSSLEQMTNVADLTEQGVNADILLAQSINNTLASNLIGTDVLAVGNTVNVTDGEVNSVMYESDTYSNQVEIVISDADGNTIRTITEDRVEAGEHVFTWDGLDDRGEEVSDGDYTVEVNSITSSGDSTALAVYVYGNVDAVRYEDSGAVLIVGNLTINFGDVIELRDPDAADGSGSETTRLSEITSWADTVLRAAGLKG